MLVRQGEKPLSLETSKQCAPNRAMSRDVSCYDAKTHQGKCSGNSRKPDRATQPPHSRLGQLSSACLEQTNLRESRRRNLPSTLAMGETKAPKKAWKMGEGEILSCHWTTQLGVLRRSRGTGRNHKESPALLRPYGPDRAAHENQRRGEPI